MATNFQTPTDLSGHTIDTGQSITTRTGSSAPISHANIDANWNRLTTKVNGIHAGLGAIHTAVNALENSSLFSSGLPTATATVKGGVKIGSGLSMNGEVLSTDTAVLNSAIDTRIATQVQADNSISRNSIESEWTWLTTPYVASVSGSGTASQGGSSVSDPTSIGWKFVQVIGLGGVPSTARQVLVNVSVNELDMWAYNPDTGVLAPYAANAWDNSGDFYANVVLHAGSAPWPILMGSTNYKASNNAVSSPSNTGGITPSTHVVVYFARQDGNGGSHGNFEILAYR